MSERKSYFVVALVALLGAALWAFWGSLFNPFHFDDSLFLQSPQVTDPGDPWYLLSPMQTRPLTYLTFYWNYRLGATAPFGYHAFGLFLHLANAIALYFFTGLLIRRKPILFEPMAQHWLPLAAAGVFALHPIQGEAVNYAYQRSTLLAAFFSILSMNAYLVSGETRRKTLSIAVSGMCYFLAVASKESALVLPMIWLALLWSEAEGLEDFKTRIVQTRWLAPLLFAAVAGGGWVLFLLHRRGERTAGLETVYGSFRYFLSEIQVLATYLRLLIWPVGQSIDHDFRPAAFVSPYAFLCYLLLACILVGAVLARKRNPTASFLALAFLIWLAPTSSLIPSADLLFEHRLYLPMAAGSILIAWGILLAVRIIAERERHRLAVCLVCYALLLGTYVVLSKKRTYVWGDNVRLWADAAAKAPRKARPFYNLGVSYLDRDHQKAREGFLKAIELNPGHAAALYNLGWLEQSAGAYDSARVYYNAAIEADPGCWQAHHGLGNLNVLRGSLQGAIREFRETQRLRPDYWPACQSLAALQLQAGDSKSALETLDLLRRLRPDLLEARYLRAYALIREGKLSEAEAEMSFIARRDPGGIYRDRIEALRGGIRVPLKGP